jgi:aspartyl/asparaginyl beta-hydroxylase (cupin superfamily)
MDKAWYSYKGGVYKGNSPFFYDTKKIDWVKKIEDNYPVIKKEIEQFMQSQGASLQPYFNSDLVNGVKSWKFGDFYFWSIRNDEYCKQIPEFDKIMNSIPGFVTAGISVLSPNTDIKAHYGDTNTSIRGHLGLSIPAAYPVCGIEVGNEQKGWEEGKMLLFCDAHLHRAWNHSDTIRYVLIIDVLQEHFISQKKNICSNVLSLIALQKLEYKFPVIRKLPGFMRGIIRMMKKTSIYMRLK